MTIDEVVEKSTIMFPRSLNIEQTELLIDYISQRIPADMYYKVSYNRNLYHTEKNAIWKEEPSQLLISCDIKSRRDSKAFDHFNCIPEAASEDTRIGMLRFNMVPDWDLHEYRQEVRELWDQVREVVEEYFSYSG